MGVESRDHGNGAADMTSAMERHIQQTNERLLCIKEALGTPGSGFQSAARELLEWCGDSRAFQKVFEQNLVGCLTVVSQVAAQQGFDLDLGYRLLAVCAAQRDKFSAKSAALLSLWCEDLGRLLLLRHQNTREDGGMHAVPPPGHKNTPPQQSSELATLGWQQQGAGGQQQPPQQLSVVTTVWGVTSTTQQPYGSTTTMAPYTQTQQPGPPNPAGYGAKQPPYPSGPPNQPLRQPTPSGGYNGYGTGATGGPAPDYQASPQPQVNLSAAALVAAAATATATATASVVALQERPQDYGQPYQNTYGPQRMPMNSSLSHPMGMSKPAANMYGGRGRYPPSPHMAAQKRPPPGGAVPPPQYMGPQQYGPPYGGYGGQYGTGKQPPQQQPGQYPPQYPPQQPMRASMRPQYQGGGPQYYQQMNGTPPYEAPHYQYQPPQPRAGGAMNSYQQIPGNPTPPLTPASNLPPPYLSSPDLKPTFPDVAKPSVAEEDELRLTFPVRDGIILAPFRLEHNLAVSNHVFHLKPSVHQTLMWRSDLELQLKCFHHEDRQMNTNWPASVQVSVNATPLSIDRGDNKTSHRPLYLKEVCQSGRNTIQITVTACCCSHLFLLQLVHRPTVRSVLQGLLRKRLLPADHCVSKIKRNFTNAAPPTPNAGAATPTEDGVEQTAIKVSLKCPITFKRITLPARGQECKHIQCFDLESYLQLNCERGAWRCPVCNKPALLEGLEVDQYIWGILTTLSSSDLEEVTIDATASWKPVKAIKEEIDGESCSGGGGKRFKAMSPNSTTMPTSSSWEMNQGLASPYTPLPDMQSALANGPPSASSNGGYPNSTGYPTPGSADYQAPHSDFGSPLSHLNDSVASLDPLAAMEKSLNHHEQQMGPPSAERPATAPHTPGNPPSVPPASTEPAPDPPTTTSDLGDLNFDPAAVIEGEGQGQEGLNLLPESVVDPMELLSYLDPPDSSGTSAAPPTSTSAPPSSDDLLSLFDS